jgi:Xaa-Pro dipeptidase
VDKNLRAEFLLELQQHNAASAYSNGSPAADRVRACKDEEEIRLMRAVSLLNDQAMLRLKDEVRLGISETELASRLLEIYHDIGADGPSFPPIVSFGANAADPHHEPDNTQLNVGDCVLFDIGCKKDGYCADMTRTFFFGQVSEQERTVYELVRRANLAGEEAIAPGVPFCDIDRAARQVIEQGGYGPNFTHRLGHSIGREVHEWGDVSSVNPHPVCPGMVFSCEPGIYLPGQVGVRIEDLCLVTPNGVEVLNQVSKELEVLPLK